MQPLLSRDDQLAVDADLTDLVDDHGDSQPALARQDMVQQVVFPLPRNPITTLTGKRVLSPDTGGCGCVNTIVMFASPAPDGELRQPQRYNSYRLLTG